MKKKYVSPSVTAQGYGVNIVPAALAASAAGWSLLSGAAAAVGMAGGYAIGRAVKTSMELHMDYSNIGHLKKVMT